MEVSIPNIREISATAAFDNLFVSLVDLGFVTFELGQVVSPCSASVLYFLGLVLLLLVNL